MALNYPSLDYPVDVRRRIDHNWQRRSAVASARGGRYLKHDRPASCPLCHGAAPIAPIASVYRGGGLIQHHWLCTPCGQAWTTDLQVTGVVS